MKILDSHCHLRHGNRERTEYTGEQIVRVMDEAGIDKTVVFGMCLTTSDSIAMAERARDAFPDRLLPYVYAIPHIAEPALPLIEEAVSSRGFPGIKLHGGETKLAPWIIDPLFEVAARHDVPVLVDFAGRAEDADRIAAAYPETTIIVAHFGRYLCTDRGLIDRFIDIAQSCPNVILDTSGVVLPWKIAEAVQRVGSERVIFGIDGPHPYPTLEGYARAEIARIGSLGLSEADTNNIFWNTAARLLKL